MFLPLPLNHVSRVGTIARGCAVARTLFYLLAALACFATIIPSVISARADWLRSHATEVNITEAIRLDPLNADGYAIKAELLERAGQLGDAELCWRKASQHNPGDAEAWVRRSLLAEQRGAVSESERCLLQAAQVNRMWLPRWSLVNFYARHGRTQQLYEASRLALERASDDVGALFPILQEGGATPGFILNLIPKNRNVVSAWLLFLLKPPAQQVGLEQGALQLAALIPQTPPAWPGADAAIWPNRSYPAIEQERNLLLSVIDRLLDGARGVEAARLWNLIIDRHIVLGTRWTPAAPLMNSQFRFPTLNAGLDWRLKGVDTLLATESGELVVRLDGHQPESMELLKQRTYIPSGAPYRLTVESQTEGFAGDHSLAWRILDPAGRAIASLPMLPSEHWSRASTNLASSLAGRIVDVVLTCQRPLGSVRARGTLRLRLVSLEQSP
jgi:tetratricopeptide (TPR) repeat protein